MKKNLGYQYWFKKKKKLQYSTYITITITSPLLKQSLETMNDLHHDIALLTTNEGREIISTDLAINLIIRAEWLFPQLFSFHDVLKIYELIDLRSSCKLFSRSLTPPPLYTVFPTSKHVHMQSLVNRLDELHQSSCGKAVPSLLLIEEGEHFLPIDHDSCVEINFPLSLTGAGRGKSILKFGLRIRGEKNDSGVVKISDLTICSAQDDGLFAYYGMKILVRKCSILNCITDGVSAVGVDIFCDDLQVVGCGRNGVWAANNATITLSGENTRVLSNAKSGDSGSYGLCAYSSKIQLVALTKEKLSIYNDGGGNWGTKSRGTIEQIDNNGTILKIWQAEENESEDESESSNEDNYFGDY